MGKVVDFSKNLMLFVRRQTALGPSLPAPSPATNGQTVHDNRRNQYTYQSSWIPTAYLQHVRYLLPYTREPAAFVRNTTYTDSYTFTVPYHCNIEVMTRFVWESPKWTPRTDQGVSYISWTQTLDNLNSQGDTIYSTGRNSATGTGESDSDKLCLVAPAWFKDVTPGTHTLRFAYLWSSVWSTGFTFNGAMRSGRSRLRMFPNGMLYNTVSDTST